MPSDKSDDEAAEESHDTAEQRVTWILEQPVPVFMKEIEGLDALALTDKLAWMVDAIQSHKEKRECLLVFILHSVITYDGQSLEEVKVGLIY